MVLLIITRVYFFGSIMTATDIPLPYVHPINLEKERKVTHKYCLEVSTSTSILKKDRVVRL
jgi:hypothetical protein